MKGHKTISKKNPEQPSMDFEFLRKKGIEFAQQLSGELWTDYNHHDPGVTILEHLCFAVTDLGYRTNFNIEDLLFAASSPKSNNVNNAFHAPADILPASPVSIADYRKIIIDHIPLVLNAWFEPIIDSIQGYLGIYRVRLQIMEEVTEEQQKEILAQTWDLLQNHRNLCEDFEEVRIMATDAIQLNARIEISPDAIGEYVLARILYELENHLTPSVKLYQIDELLEKGLTISEIFEGPEPLHGIIQTSELPPLKKELYSSILKEVLANTDGVMNVEDLVVRKNGVRVKGDVIQLDSDKYPSLDVEMTELHDHAHPLQLYKNGLILPVNLEQVMQLRDNLIAKERKGYQLEIDLQRPKPRSHKKLPGIEEYYSMQCFFPQVYGIGEYGLPFYADRTRQAQAAQLKSYLLIFEQFLSSYLAQLAHVRYLFSIEEGEHKTYFSRFPETIPSLSEIFEEDETRQLKQYLDQWTQSLDTDSSRRNRFLDHLMARFSEEFTSDYILRLQSQMGENENQELEKELTASKSLFLRNYQELSRNRGLAFNYTKDSWETDNISGLKKRLSLFLNVKDAQNRLLAATPAIASLQILNAAQVEEKKTENSSKVAFPLREMLRFGVHRNRYKVVKNKDLQEYQAIYQRSPDAKSKVLYRSSEKVKCKEIIDRLIGILRQINRSSEGFYLIENILLRPRRKRQWKIIIGKEKEQAFMESTDYGELQDLQHIGDDLLITATNRNNYEIIREGTDFVFLLKDDDEKVLLKSTKSYSEKDAPKAINGFIAQLEEIKKSQPSDIDNWIYFEAEKISGYDIPNKFYSHQLSLVIPAWSARFSSKAFRSFFEKMLLKNVPAHLGVKFHWLNFPEMKEFESAYRQWLDAISHSPPRQPYLDNLSFQIADFLQNQNHELPEDRVPDQSRGYGELFAEEQLQIIEGIGEKIEKLLKDAGINSWKKLEESDTVKLRTILNQGGPAFRMHDPASWPTQAMMASNGQWEGLVNFQKFLNAAPDAGEAQLSPSKIEKMAFKLLYPQFELNDLKVIEGIGEKVEEILLSCRIRTWTDLAEVPISRLYRMMAEAGPRFYSLRPDTWPEQAQMAAAGKWKALRRYQQMLGAK